MAPGAFSLAAVGEFVGRELGVSDWLTVDQARIDAFADCTGDHNWIHVDAERAAREGPFGTTVAHGYLTLSLLPQLSYSIGLLPPDAAQMLNYGVERARFVTPVRSGARVRARVVLLAAEARGAGRWLLTLRNTVEIEGADRPALVADTLALAIAAGAA